jgi:hypothetical protein
MSREYTCAHCRRTFIGDWSEEEAKADLKEYFGDIPLSECVQVCDDCYQKMHPKDHPTKVLEALRQRN